MKLIEDYSGVTLTFHYDRHTGTYLGFLEGLSVETSVQAPSYEDLIDAFHEAVDTYTEDRFALASFCVRREREVTMKRTEAVSPRNREEPGYL